MMNLSLIKLLVASLEKAATLADLGQLLDTPEYALAIHAQQPEYRIYHVRKASGGNRLIEDPSPSLKEIQRRLNDFLQAHYHQNRPLSSYGFQLALSREKEPRNIKTNALQHLGKPWMVNIDFKDFFHQVTAGRLSEVFENTFPAWSADLAEQVIRLCTFGGRLPMGAPTSPVLANMAVKKLDEVLERYATDEGLTYTRFVDDLTFSSLQPLTDHHLRSIKNLCKAEGMLINPGKTWLYPPDQPKIVTGLYVDAGVRVSTEFKDELMADITKFKSAMEISAALENGRGVKKALQQLEGRIQFLEFVEGRAAAQEAKKALSLAKVVDRFAMISWNRVDYHRFIKPPEL